MLDHACASHFCQIEMDKVGLGIIVVLSAHGSSQWLACVGLCHFNICKGVCVGGGEPTMRVSGVLAASFPV